MVREIVRTSVLGLLLCAGVSSAVTYKALGEASTVWKNSRMQTNFISGFDWNSNITPYLSSKKTGTHTLYVEAQYKNSSSQYYSDDGGSIYYGYLSNGSIITDLVSPKPSSPSLSVASSSGSVTVFSENDLNKYIDKIKETTYQNYTYNKYWNIRFYLTNYKAGGEIAGSDTIKLVHWDYAMPPRVKIYQDYLENYSSAQGYKYYRDADSSVTKINDLNYTGGLLRLGVDVLYADKSNGNLKPVWVVYTCRFENGAEHATCAERGRINIPVTSGTYHKLTVKDTLSSGRSSTYNSISKYVSKRDSSVIVYAEAKSRVIEDDGGIQRYVTVSSDEIEMRMTRTVKLVQNIEGGSATIKYSNGNIWNGENVGVGETLTLTATPKPGYKFEYWTDGYDNHIISYNNTFSLRIMDGHYDSLYPVFSTVEFWVSHFANSANGERTNCDKVNAYASCTADRDYIFGRDSLNLNARFKATSTLQFAPKVNMFLFAQIDDNESSRVGIHEMLASDLANNGYSYTKDWKFGEKHAELMESVKSTLTYKVGYVSAGKTDTAWSSPITFTKKYPVTFVDADGKALQDGAYYYNDETVTAPQAPEKEGCEFIGWNGEYQLVTNPLVVTPVYGCSITPAVSVVEDAFGKHAVIDEFMGDEDEFNITEEIDIDDIQLARNFPVGVYTTVILPFSVNTANLEGVDSILVFGGMTYDENNKLAVVMDVVWENTRDDVDLEAYTPYLIKTTGEKIGVLGSVTLEKTQNASVQQDGWEFCGVYANKTWNEGDPEIGVAYGYAASSDEALGVSVGDFVKVAAGAYIRPLHAYLIKLNPSGIAPNGSYVRKSSQSLPDKMSIVIVDGKKGGEGLHTTSIGKHNTRASEFRMNFVPSIYDLKGRKVGNGRKAKGVYLNK